MPRRLPFALSLILALAACGEDSLPGAPGVSVGDTGGDAPCVGLGCKPCEGAADKLPCDDGDPCTTGDFCLGGQCAGEEMGCACHQDADCAAAEDGDLCNGTLYCEKATLPWKCAIKPTSVVNCGNAGLCADAVCQPATGQCKTVPKPAGAPCEDGDACTAEACDGAGQCAPKGSICACKTDLDCAAVEDGDLCNGTLVCDTEAVPHVCVVAPETVVTCKAPGQPCRQVGCVKQSGLCVETVAADGAACDDGDPCTQDEHCKGGACAPAELACPCTSDAACALSDDGNLCNGVPFCNLATGKCQNNPATVVVCPTAGNTTCRKRICQPSTGVCADVDTAKGVPCDDGNACTSGEACAGGKCTGGQQSCQCKTHADCAAMEDGNFCNGTLYCDAATHSCVVNPASVIDCPEDPDAPCKFPVCQPVNGTCAVQLAVEGTPCDDGEPCTEGDKCVGGKCKAGASLVCPCLGDADCAKFEDGDLCNGTLFCDKAGVSSACVVNPASMVTCTTALDTVCLSHVCDKGTGVCNKLHAAEGSVCDDGDPCTGPDGCKAGGCQGGALSCDDGDPCSVDACSVAAGGCLHTPKLCGDGNPCTADGCEGGVCTHLAASGGCDDGDPCTHTDKCAGGTCAGAPLDCSDGQSCTQDACVAGKGCVHLPLAGTACDDGDACTGADACAAGKCAGKPLSANACADETPCTLDTCHPAAGCLHTPVDGLPCSDGDACTQGDTCLAGSCVGAAKAGACDDGNPCTEDVCAPSSGCLHKPNTAPCDDNDPCTAGDTCGGGQCLAGQVLACACKQDSDCASKEDGNLCNGTLFCNKAALPWKCVVKASTVVTCDLSKDTPCATSSCVPETGACVSSAKADGESCTPGADKCVGGVCKAGACAATGAPPNCDDGNACTADLCSAALGCANLAAPLNGKACSDGDSCTAGEACKAGQCAGGKPLPCDDGNGCTVDVCSASSGCGHKSGLLDGKACSDGDACTSGDKCTGDKCTPGAATDCADGNPCTVDVCHPVSGCGHLAAPLEGQPCADKSACTVDETCKAGKCVFKQVDCDDDNPCTADVCQDDKGCTHGTGGLEGKACTHPSGCVVGSQCKAGYCSGGDSSKCGNLGDCAVQPDSLFAAVGQASGTVGFAFQKGAGGFALVEGAGGKLAGLSLSHPVAAPWTSAWTQALAQTASSSPAPVAVSTEDGGLIVGGGTAIDQGGGALSWQRWIRRLDAKGQLVWDNKIAAADAPVRDLIALKDGSFAFVASPTGTTRSVVSRFTAAGGTVWQRADRGPSSSLSYDQWNLRRLAAHPDGGLVAVGGLDKPAGSGSQARALAVRYHPSGTSLIYTTTVPGGWSTRWHDLVVLGDGTAEVVGERQLGSSTPLRPWHARLSANGQVLAQGEVLAVPAERVLDAVQVAADGSLVVASHARDVAGKGLWRLELQRLGAKGEAVWSRAYPVAGAHQQVCPGCLAPAAADGWQLGVVRTGEGQPPSTATPVYLRTGPWGHESCAAAGKCGATALADCSDQLACTLDLCDPAKGCLHTPRDEVCDDGNVCTQDTCDPAKGCVSQATAAKCTLLGSCEITACQQGTCQTTGVMVDCGDGNPCTQDECSTLSGCIHTALTAGSLCRNRDNCKEGTCIAGSNQCSHSKPLDCYDDDPCTADACTPGKGCTHTPLDGTTCNDGDACTTGETCKGGSCTGGTLKACGTGMACTAGFCHSATCSTTGLTFTGVTAPSLDGEPVVQRFVAYPSSWGYPPDGNPYKGDTDCKKKIPLLCHRNWGYAYPVPYAEWSSGEMRATAPVMGCGVTSQAVGNKLCTDAFGSGWYWFHWHVTGQNSYGWGRVPKGVHMWTLIKDQANGNCWK